MKRLRWQLLIVALALVAIALLLLSQQPVLEEFVPVQPATGGIYSEALVGSIGRLNPVFSYNNQPDRDINRLLYSGLVKFDDQGLPMGDLAESWGISQDGKVYNFSLRPNAYWHDGQPVVSNDVIFTVDLLRDENAPIPDDQKDLWNQVEVLELDQQTLQFRLPESFAPFLDYLTFGILPQHLLENTTTSDLLNSPFNLQPVGSGPFKFDHFETENNQINSTFLTAFDAYYNGRPFFDQVVFRYYPDTRAALTAYEQENVLGISQVDDDILGEVLKIDALNLYTGRLPRLTLVYLNLDDEQLPFFQQPEIRRALLMALNRQRIVDRFLNGQAIIADGPIFPGTWAYYENIEHIKYDPEYALDIIKDAGYTFPAEGGNVRTKDEVAFSFDLIYPNEDIYPNIAESIQRDWSKLGIQVNLVPVTYADLINSYLEPRTYQAVLVSLDLTGTPDPDPYPFWDQGQSTDGQNFSMWSDRQASEFLERARISTDIGERTKAYRNFQVRFATETPALPLYYPVYSYAVDAQVQGVRIGSFFQPSDRFNTLATWYLIAKRPIGIESNPTPTP
jgi:peptide/nickel transport system substrate-binding protein